MCKNQILTFYCGTKNLFCFYSMSSSLKKKYHLTDLSFLANDFHFLSISFVKLYQADLVILCRPLEPSYEMSRIMFASIHRQHFDQDKLT